MLQVARSRMVALVDELEQRNLIERRRSSSDRRAYALALTADGQRLLDQAIIVTASFEAELTQPLDANEREQLLNLLRRLAAQQDIPLGVHPGLAAQAPSDARC